MKRRQAGNRKRRAERVQDGTLQRLRRRVRSICAKLEKHFGPARPPRPFDPLSELVFTILSQNTADRNSEAAYAALRTRYRSWQELARADLDELAATIRVAGLANQKAPRIRTAVRWALEQFGERGLDPLRELDTEKAAALLRQLKGIGPKTVACVLLFACGKPVLPVDTHVARVAKRLGLIPPKCTAERAHQLLGQIVPEELVLAFHVHLIALGRTICRARNPRCGSCPLRRTCPSSQPDNR